MNKIYFSMLVILFFGCKNKVDESPKNKDESFNLFKERFIEEFWKINPEYAVSIGYHKYDSVLSIRDANYRKQQDDFARVYLDSLKRFELTSLDPLNQMDYHLIENTLQSGIWYNNEFKKHEWDPSNYNLGGGFADILIGSYQPLEQRLKSLFKRLSFVPDYYQAAKKQVRNPTLEHTQLAISQNEGSLSVFKDMEDSLKQSALPDSFKKQMTVLIDSAESSIKSYVNWLKSEILPTVESDKGKSYRIGKHLFHEKFKYDIVSDYTAEEIYKIALEQKKVMHQKMAEVTYDLWIKYFKNESIPTDTLEAVRKMIDRLSLIHAHPDSFQLAIEKQIPELTAFVNEKKLLDLDPSKPLKVRKEPGYMSGVAAASISAPGPYDKNANTYYNVGSLEDYAPEQAESFLREYNKYILQIINIHEAIPGHYAQLVYSNQAPSIIKSVFGNRAIIEGWAVYTERMMVEAGYGGNEPEMWLMYYKWHLRSICNTILDYSLHCLNMPEEKGLELLMKEAFQQEAEAKGKWKRATLTQVQLCSYFTGFREIFKLREDLKKSKGDTFNLKEFHEEFLSYGSAPVKYIRKLMLREERKE